MSWKTQSTKLSFNGLMGCQKDEEWDRECCSWIAGPKGIFGTSSIINFILGLPFFFFWIQWVILAMPSLRKNLLIELLFFLPMRYSSQFLCTSTNFACSSWLTLIKYYFNSSKNWCGEKIHVDLMIVPMLILYGWTNFFLSTFRRWLFLHLNA